MIKLTTSAIALTLMMTLTGCGDSSSSSPPPAPPPSVPTAATTTDHAADASKSIDQSNAKSELDKLEAEIDADTEE